MTDPLPILDAAPARELTTDELMAMRNADRKKYLAHLSKHEPRAFIRLLESVAEGLKGKTDG